MPTGSHSAKIIRDIETSTMWVLDFLNIYTAIACVLLYLWYHNRKAYRYWHHLNVKYLEPIPFLGNNPKALFHMATYHEEYDLVYKSLYDDPFGGIYELLQPKLIVKDPQLVSHIMIRDFKHFTDHGLKQITRPDKKLDPMVMHLFFVDGERWRLLRHRLSPVFTAGKLKLMYDHIVECVHQLAQHMDTMDGSDVETKELFQKLTIDVIGSCAFGIECNSFKSNQKFAEMGKQSLEPRFALPLRMMVATYSQRLANLLNIKFLTKEVNDFFVNLTLDTIDYRRRNGVTRNDLLQLLMELQNTHVDPKFAVGDRNKKGLAGEDFDELDIAANLFFFFIAGYETTASTLSFCLYELALNEDVQEKLRSEVQRVKEKNSNLTFNLLKEFTYMDAVINETLRKYPPVPFLNRTCTEDYIIPGTETTIPVGTDILIPVWSIQHDWRNYPNPEVFDPERFLGDNKRSLPSGVFLPFGDGPRYCLGQRFADMEIKATLPEIIMRYDIKPCAKTEIPLKFKNSKILLDTTSGVWVSLVKRK